MSTGSRTGLTIGAIIVVVVVIALAFGLLRVKQTQDTKLPQVSVEGGQAPKFDVATAKVEVGTKETTVPVPVIGTKKEAISLPTVSVKKAGE